MILKTYFVSSLRVARGVGWFQNLDEIAKWFIGLLDQLRMDMVSFSSNEVFDPLRICDTYEAILYESRSLSDLILAISPAKDFTKFCSLANFVERSGKAWSINDLLANYIFST